jgi:hypothetical protein
MSKTANTTVWLYILFISPVAMDTFINNVKAETAESKNVPYSFPKGGFQLYESEDKNERLTLGGEILFRYDYWNWFATDKGKNTNNDYGFGFQRTRLNLKYASENMELFFQPQYVQMFGLPDDAVSDVTGPFGMGGLYYLHNHDRSPYDIGTHQAYARLNDLFDTKLFFKVGRFEYSDGLEVQEKKDGEKFNTLKNMRLADRMISSFDWSAFSRSFDGVLGGWNDDEINLTTSYFYPTQGGWEQDIDETINDIDITTATLTAKKGWMVPDTEFAVFFYNYDDKRDCTQRPDNVSPTSDRADIDVQMYGGHVLGIYDFGPGQVDTLLWGGVQTGDWYGLDHNANAVAGEVGYQFTKMPWKPWFRTGYFIGSGDSDPSDGDHETFFQMAPGTRKYQMYPYYDLENNKDFFVQLITKPTQKLTTRMDYHIIKLDESEDRWYMGSGPTQESGQISGYIPRNGGGRDALSQEFSIMLSYALSPQCDIAGFYEHVWGEGAIKNVYEKDNDADYFSLEIRYKF